MRDVIQKIIATEGEAKLTLEEARTEADRIILEAQKKRYEVIERARQEAITEADKIMETEVESAEQIKQKRLTEAAAEIESQIQLEPASRKWAIEEVVRCVCKQS